MASLPERAGDDDAEEAASTQAETTVSGIEA